MKAVFIMLLSLNLFPQYLIAENFNRTEERNIISQEITGITKDEGMLRIYLESGFKEDYVVLDCQSFIHELKFIKAEQEQVNYMIPDSECQELYSDLIYRMESGKPTCLMIDQDSLEVFTRPVCWDN